MKKLLIIIGVMFATNMYAIQWPWEYKNYEECVYEKSRDCGANNQTCEQATFTYCDKEFPWSAPEWTEKDKPLYGSYPVISNGVFSYNKVGKAKLVNSASFKMRQDRVKICVTNKQRGHDSCLIFNYDLNGVNFVDLMEGNWKGITSGGLRTPSGLIEGTTFKMYFEITKREPD